MSGILRRRMMMHGEALPYDAEVQYLRFTGTQYVDTGIAADAVNVEASMTLRLASASQIAGLLSLYDGGIRYYLLDLNSEFIYSCKFSGTFTWEKAARLAYSDTSTFRTYTSQQTLSSVTIVRPATSATATNMNSSASTSSEHYYLGARNDMSVGTPLRFFSGDIHDAWIKKNGVYVMDYISVRVGTVGYYYDRVTGSLRGPSGGALIVGPDV